MLVLVFLVATSGRAIAETSVGDFPADADGPVDLLCAHAPKGTVQPVPPPFNYWVVLVCAERSQALVPIEGMKWVKHGTDETISILALPPGATPMPPAEDYVPGYRVRFKSLFAAEVTGDKRKRIMTMLKEHLARDASPAPLPSIDHVFQLDAVSVIYDMRYNIYFYIHGLQPVEGIACIDACKQTLFFDIEMDQGASTHTPLPDFRQSLTK
jgi:hypothetical protein